MIGLLLVAFVPVLTSLTLYRDFTGDDTFIRLVFARNVASGQGFSFNPGEPTYGASSPLWVLLIAALSRLTHEFFWTARVTSLLFSVSAVLTVFALAHRVVHNDLLALLASMAFAIDPHFAKFAFSGMETSLAIFLVMSSLCLVADDVEKRRTGVGLSTIALALATLTRPECVLLFAVCLFDRLRRLPRSEWLSLVGRVGVVYVLFVGPWWLYAWLTFGTVVPNTAVAKSSSGLTWAAVRSSSFTLLRLMVASYGSAFALLLLGWAGVLIKQRRVRSSLSLAAALWLCLWLGAQVFKGVDVVARYVLLVSPLIIVAAIEALAHLAAPFPRKKRSLVVILGISAVVVNSAVLTGLLIYPAAVEFTRGFESAYTDMGLWLAGNTPPDTTVAVADIGAIGYFSHRRIYDLGGLVTPEAIPYMWGNEGRYVELVRPDYLIIRSVGAPPVFDDWGISCAQATPILTRSFRAVGSRTLGIPQFSTLYRLTWLPTCSE